MPNDIVSSVVITTYEDDFRLEATIRAFFKMTRGTMPFEIIVVNDGGKSDTRTMLQEACASAHSSSMVDSSHPWVMPERVLYGYLNPPSSDFRLAAARNIGIQAAAGKQVIICDCDTVPHRAMVVHHQLNYRGNLVLVGLRNRVAIDIVEGHSPAQLDAKYCDLLKYMEDERQNEPHLWEKYSKIGHIQDPWSVCWGCNFSAPTEPLRNLGGFDEDFIGWGGEDEDMARRLLLHGLSFHSIPNSLVYHLDHVSRTDVNASNVFYGKFDEDIVRNGGPLREQPAPLIWRSE